MAPAVPFVDKGKGVRGVLRIRELTSLAHGRVCVCGQPYLASITNITLQSLYDRKIHTRPTS